MSSQKPLSGQKRRATLMPSAAGSWKNVVKADSAAVHLLPDIEPDLSTVMNVDSGVSVASASALAHWSSPPTPLPVLEDELMKGSPPVPPLPPAAVPRRSRRCRSRRRPTTW